MNQRWGLPIVAWPSRFRPSFWDGVALPLVIGGIMLFAWASQQMSVPFHPGQAIHISLDPRHLPEYALRTVMRMALALALSLVFSIGYAAVAAKSKRAEKLLIPVLDILQSVPILGFLSITVTGFIALFPGRLLGYECAAIFAIFTSQAWNMTFSLYQSFLGVPNDLREAARMYHLSRWHGFWQLEMPFALPQLVWNMMMSVSGGWFFVVASEAISVSGNTVLLPGIGSYISLAIDQRDLHAVASARQSADNHQQTGQRGGDPDLADPRTSRGICLMHAGNATVSVQHGHEPVTAVVVGRGGVGCVDR